MRRNPKYQSRFQMMGTFIDLMVCHPDGERLIKQSYQQLRQFAQRFTVNQQNADGPSSELMQVNQQAGIAQVEVAADLYQLIKTAKAVSADNRNPFNIAIGPLVKTWRIGFADAQVPSQAAIDEKLALVNPEHIVLNDAKQSVYLKKSGMEIDLGAIAKGYFADVVKALLIAEGVESAIINLGGNVQTIGNSPETAESPEKPWMAGIQHPLATRGKIIRAVPLHDFALVTSGINERYFQAGGQRYHHLLNPLTGKPIETDIASVSILAKQAIDAEIWSTAGFFTSAEDSIHYLEAQQNIQAVLVNNKGDILFTSGLRDTGSCIYPL